MRSYESQVDRFGMELADDIIMRETYPNWDSPLRKNDITSSISRIYDMDLRKVVEDLEDSIKKNVKNLRIIAKGN